MPTEFDPFAADTPAPDLPAPDLPAPDFQAPDAPAPDTPQSQLPAGAPRQVRDYRIERQLGRGGMANVYLGRRPDGAIAAVKMLHPELAKDAGIVQRFLLEMRASATLVHDHVLRLLDWGEFDGTYFLVTEYMDGGSVRDLLIRSGKKVPPPVAEAIVAMLLRALEHAHEAGIIHRDIKPANLMVSSDGTVRLADFGIARTHQGHGLTRTGMLIGTPAYMSPEQAAGRPVDNRSDLFAVGIVLYELLTGINPFASDDNEMATLANVLQSEPRILFELDPTIPPHLEAFATRLLQRDPSRRPSNATEALAELEAASPGAIANARATVYEALHDPAGTSFRYATQQAQVHYQRARKYLDAGVQARPRAILELYRTLLLLPEHELALRALREQFGDRDPFGAPSNPKILELEAELSHNPGNVALLLQLASLYKLELAFPKAIACYKRVLKLRPDDPYTAGQLNALMGDDFAPTHHTRNPAGASAGATSNRQPGTHHSAQPAQPAPPATGRHSRISPKVQMPSGLPLQRRRLGPLVAVIAAVVVSVVGLKWVGHSTSTNEEAPEALRLEREDGAKKSDATLAARLGTAAVRTITPQKGPEADLHHVTTALREGNLDEAERLLVRNDDRAPRARLLLGQVFLKQHRPLDALEELETFLRMAPADPGVPQARLLLATALHDLGQSSEAMIALDELIAEHPASPLVTDAYALQGTIFEKQGDLETALVRHQQVMSRTGPADSRHRASRLAAERLEATIGSVEDVY